MLSASSANAADGEPARLRVTASLLDEVLRTLLPGTLVVPSAEDSPGGGTTAMVLTEARYCGVTDKGAGHLRLVARPATGRPGLPMLREPGDCQASLTDIAKRAPSPPDLATEGALLDVEATWRPWELRLAVVKGVPLKPAGDKPRGNLDRRRDILSIPTGDTRINTDNGVIALYAMPVFLSASVDVAVWSSPPGGHPERGSADARGPRLIADANAAVEIPLGLANQVLGRLTGQRALTISVNREDIDLQDVSAQVTGSGERTRLTVVGKASPRSVRETMTCTVAGAGDPLRVSFVQMSPKLEDCSGLGTMAAVACNVRNGARTTAAEAFAGSLNQRYQGQAVHELASPQDVRFTIAGQRIELVGSLLRMNVSPRGLWTAAKLAPVGR
jgi:hypothetical protein